MNTPIDWILPPEEILGLLQESSMVKTGLKVRFNDIEDQFPNSGYRSLVANSVAKFAKVDAEAQIVMIAASGEGADLSHSSSQEKIQHIANEDNWPAELTQWVLNRCVQLKYRWQSEGFGTEPTLEEVTARKTAELLAKEAKDKYQAILAMRDQWDLISRTVRSEIESGSVTSSQVPARVNALWQR